MNKQAAGSGSKEWSVTLYFDKGDTGSVSIVHNNGKDISTQSLALEPGSSLDQANKPVYIGLDKTGAVLLMDPETRAISKQDKFPSDAYAPYAYPHYSEARHWYSNDGDKETGSDALTCGNKGSPVYVVHNTGDSADVLKTICLGRGHHVVTFTAPSDKATDVPVRAFVSNLLDGTISVIGNDPADAETYLNVVAEINLCDSDKEKDHVTGVPNNAFPHGMAYSPLTGKVYNMNNGYGTIVVINPVNNQIEDHLEMKVSSNLLLSADGRYLVGKGADRKSDPDHVVGRLTVVDALGEHATTVLDLQDVYPSTYRFNPSGDKLYVTTAATGKGVQRDNVIKDIVYVYDATAFPELKLLKEIPVGVADCGRRPIAFYEYSDGKVDVLIPDPTDGTLTIVNGDDDSVRSTVKVDEGSAKEVAFSFWDGAIYGS